MLAALSIVGFTLHACGPVVVPILLALCLVLAVQPLVELFDKWGWPGVVSVSAGMTTVLVGLALFAGALVFGVNRLLAELPAYEVSARELQKALAFWFSSHGMTRVALSIQSAQPGTLFVGWSLSLARDVPAWAGHGLFVLALTLFMLLERNSFRSKFSKRLVQFARSNDRVVRDVQHYLAVKTLVSVITGLTATIWCSVWGLHNALLWGVLAFVLNYIPVAGSIAAAIPPIGIALLMGDVSQLVGVTVGYAAINTIVGGILEPRWLGRACGLSPLVVLMSMVIWGAMLGPVGALLSVPLTSALRRGLSHLRDFTWLSHLMTADAAPTSEVPTTLRAGLTNPPSPDTLTAASQHSRS